MLTLIDVEAIHVEREFLPKALLDLLHLSVIPEWEVVDCVREFQWAAIHVKLLDNWPESMSREMEIARDLVNDCSALHYAALAIIQGLQSVSVYLLMALAGIRKVSSIIHYVVYSNVIPIPINSMLVEAPSDVNHVHSGHIDHIQAQDVAWRPMHGYVHVYVQLKKKTRVSAIYEGTLLTKVLTSIITSDDF